VIRESLCETRRSLFQSAILETMKRISPERTFMEAVHVQLADEGRNIGMFEVLAMMYKH
jgi:hypothetical protein